MKFIPHKFQEKAIKFVLERACAGLFLEPGMGKTSIILAMYDVLRAKGMVKKMLVLAPLRPCYATWPAEVQKWDCFQHLSVGILHGPQKDAVLQEEHDIYVMNYEGLKWLEAASRNKQPFDILIVDESSKLKHTRTQRFKTIKKLVGKFKRRYILTGSPAANSLLDLFGQIYTMDMGATFGPFISQYRETFFIQSGYGGYEWRLKPGADKQIHALLAPRVMHLAAADYLELPPLIEVDVHVKLPDIAQLQYLEMEKKLRIEFDTGKVVAANAAVASMHCRQLANGGIYIDAAVGTFEHIHDAKTEAVLDLIEELEGQPTLIAYDFQHDLVRLKKALGEDVPHIGGGVSPKKSQEIIAAWNRGEIPVLLGHPMSMSHGLNMQGAGRAIIWHSLTWSLEDREQFIRRVWRQGQEGRVFLYNIIADRTIDVAIMGAVKSKAKGQSALLNALRNYWN